jgi:hypothetical protein
MSPQNPGLTIDDTIAAIESSGHRTIIQILAARGDTTLADLTARYTAIELNRELDRISLNELAQSLYERQLQTFARIGAVTLGHKNADPVQINTNEDVLTYLTSTIDTLELKK